jgi:hypothetical protein
MFTAVAYPTVTELLQNRDPGLVVQTLRRWYRIIRGYCGTGSAVEDGAFPDVNSPTRPDTSGLQLDHVFDVSGHSN